MSIQKEKASGDVSTETLVLQSLKEKWFREVCKENYPHTPEITETLDKLAKTIREVAAREKEAS